MPASLAAPTNVWLTGRNRPPREGAHCCVAAIHASPRTCHIITCIITCPPGFGARTFQPGRRAQGERSEAVAHRRDTHPSVRGGRGRRWQVAGGGQGQGRSGQAVRAGGGQGGAGSRRRHLLLEDVRRLPHLLLRGATSRGGARRGGHKQGRDNWGRGLARDATRGGHRTAASRLAGESRFGLASIEMVEIRMDCHHNTRSASAQVGSQGGWWWWCGGGGGGCEEVVAARWWRRGGGVGLPRLCGWAATAPMRSHSRTSPPQANEGCCAQRAGARRVGERPLRAGMQV